MSGKWAKTQPKNGDTLLHCGHLDDENMGCHWFGCDISFARPDGTTGRASWIAVCDVCYRTSGGDVQKVQIRGDATWMGDDPVIKAPTLN
jgi:hypothetical protein